MKHFYEKSKRLMGLCIIAYLFGSICSFIYTDVLNLDNCEPPITAHWQAQIIGWVYLLGCIVPMLLFTYRAAKCENARLIRVVTLVMIFHIAVVFIAYLYLLITNPSGVIH